jgi:acetoin utilization protein AcuC
LATRGIGVVRSLLVHTPRYRTFSFGSEHPMRPVRLHLAYTLISACHLLEGAGVSVEEPELPAEETVLLAHEPEYLAALKASDGGRAPADGRRYGLGEDDNPVFPGVYEWSMLACGGTLRAVRAAASGEADRSFHPGGGHHHARPARAAGFCYLNDINVALAEQARSGKRILYLDLDAHHADGVAGFFWDDDRVLVVSLHEWGETLFPGKGNCEELGEGKGFGKTINLPLLPGTSDPVYREAFETVVAPLYRSFAPDLVVLQSGVDAMSRDPIAHLAMTTAGFTWFLENLLELVAPGRVAALGGGGYEVDTVARCWTLEWGILSEQEVCCRLPDPYLRERSRLGATGIGTRTVRDPVQPFPDQARPREHLHSMLRYLRGRGVLPPA